MKDIKFEKDTMKVSGVTGEKNLKETFMAMVAKKVEEMINHSVVIRKGEAVVRSDALAKVFDRLHKTILRTIRTHEKRLEDAGIIGTKKSRYFWSEKVARQGGETDVYWLTRKGFDLVALSLTGEKAFVFKLMYIERYHEMQELIFGQKLEAKLHTTDIGWRKLREEGKSARRELTDAIHEAITLTRLTEGKENDGHYFKHYTKMIYRKLGINIPMAVNPRDVLDVRDLVRLEDMEKFVAKRIMELHEAGVHYKDAFKIIKSEVEKK